MKSIVITGFMGSGKSTVGNLVSVHLGFGFVDLDAVISARSGHSIRELMHRHGEAAFRELERKSLMQFLSRRQLVIATGGGTLTQPGMMDLALSRSYVATLDAPFDVLWQRIHDDADRPLVARGIDALQLLKGERDREYYRAHLVVDTCTASPDGVAQLIADGYKRSGASHLNLSVAHNSGTFDAELPSTLSVPVNGEPYQIDLGVGIRHRLGATLRQVLPTLNRVVIITNPTVNALYGEDIKNSLLAEGYIAHLLEVPDEEDSKRLAVVEQLLRAMLELKLERSDGVVALGGGVVGDLAGFVASIYLRGIALIQVPTTLLSQVDSSVGGKTGVNSPFGKNLIGTFYQPNHVHIDLETLATLDLGNLTAGMAEVIKYGLIRDAAFYKYLETTVLEGRWQSANVLQRIVTCSCQNKIDVVFNDPTERGERAVLNFGHTLAHGLETMARYGAIKHGHAVAMGMLFATWLSQEFGRCDAALFARIRTLLQALPIDLALPECSPEQLFSVIAADKKVNAGRMRFVGLSEVGRACFLDVPLDQLSRLLAQYIEKRA